MIQRIAALLIATLVPVPALAQALPESGGLKREALPTVFVLDDRGVETRGKLLKLDRETIVLLIDGTERRFDMRTVSRVDRRGDSLKNGAAIGAAIGVLLGVLASGMAECVENGHVTGCGMGARLAMGAISTGMYAAVGAGVDAAITGRTRLYEAPRVRRPVSASSRGTSFVVRFAW